MPSADAAETARAERPRRRGLLAALALTGSGMWLSVVSVLLLLCLRAGTPLLALLCGVGLAAGLLLPIAAWTASARRRRRAGLGLAACLALAAAALAPWPRGGDPDALVRDVHLEGGGGAPWCSLIPEREVVRLGAFAQSASGEYASTVEPGLFEAVYDEVAAGGVVPSPASRVLDAWLVDRGHYWLAVPDGEGPFPLLVFLHGNAGPFQFYPQVLAPPLIERGVAVAFPTWDFGVWDRPGGLERVEAVVAHALASAPLDPERVAIGGLSAGGLGAVRAFAARPEAFAACLAISGVPADAPAEPFVGRPLLVVHGVDDARLPVASARDLAARVEAAGGDPDYLEVASDHFLLLNRRAEVVPRVADWVAEATGAR